MNPVGLRAAPPSWRLLTSGPADAAWNMAVDRVLLEGAARRPTVRLYEWDPPAVSLGRFQRDLPAAFPRGVPWVRRPTGGGAIYHFREVTFAVACSLHDSPLRGDRLAAYRTVNGAIAIALGRIGVKVRPWEGPAIRSGGFCFDSRSPSDLMHGRRKIVGTAQRRRRGTLLLHGSLPLEPNPCTASATCLGEAAGRQIPPEEAVALLVRGFEVGFGIDLVPAPLTRAERDAAALRRETMRDRVDAPGRRSPRATAVAAVGDSGSR